MAEKTLLLDGSRWQWGSKPDYSFDASKPPDLRKAKSAGANAVYWRATYGDFYTDPSFKLTYALALEAGLDFGAYHVVAPDGPAESQIERFTQACSEMSLLPPVLDCELARGMDKKAVTACIQKCVDLVREICKCDPVIYTRQSWWDKNVLAWSGWSRLALWAARYKWMLAGPWSDNRYRFRDWDRWSLWQFSADGNGRGAEYGMRSTSVDLDWFNGSLGDFAVWAGLEPAPLTVEQRLARLEAQVLAHGWELVE